MGNQGVSPHFEVDKKGLAKILARRGKEFILPELVQNAWDEPGVTKVVIGFRQANGEATIEVVDDAPEGFQDLTHAYTLFAESRKKTNVQQRGRFNIGEKLVVAVCDTVTIATTKGTILFTAKGRMHNRDKLPVGTKFVGTLKMNKDEAEALRALAMALIPPAGIVTTFNGQALRHREAAATLRVTLPTEMADAEGYLRATRRQTDVKLYTVAAGEKATLYEMGIPVVETGDTYHIDVQQKVPLNADRDNVRPSYLQELRTAVLNHMATSMSAEDTTAKWVGAALEDKHADVEAVATIIKKRYGDKVVINDPSDPEGTKIAVTQGYTVLPSRAFSHEAWENVKLAGVKPAGQVTPSPKPYTPGGRPENVIPESEWTDDMRRTVEFADMLHRVLVVGPLSVRIVHEPHANWRANYGSGPSLALNYGGMGYLSKDFFANVGGQDQLELFLHEFAHARVSDHLSYKFADEVGRLGAKLVIHLAGHGHGERANIRVGDL